MYTGALVPLNVIITFPQVRQTFEEGPLQELADDIAVNGVLQPSIVGKLSYEFFVLYKKTFEMISKRVFNDIESYPEHKGFYYCLIAGERRYRAHKVLWEKGCSDCNSEAVKKSKQLKPGECYKSHFHDENIEIRSCLNIDPLRAKSTQFIENNYVKPPLHEEAYAYEEFFNFRKLTNPKITFKEFATDIGISVERVKNAIWFCQLPEKAQLLVKKKFITYTNALELKRILLSEFSENEKQRIVDREMDYLMLHPRVKNEEYKKRVKDILGTLHQGLLFAPTEAYVGKKGKRKIVEEHSIPYLTLFHTYMKRVGLLKKEGVIGKEKIFSGRSPNHQIGNITNDLQLLFPGLLSEKQVKRINAMDFEKGCEVVTTIISNKKAG